MQSSGSFACGADRGLHRPVGSMAERLAWVLNLDAEHELDDPTGYRASEVSLQRQRIETARVRDLVGPRDVVVWPLASNGLPRSEAEGLRGYCWCPTPRALQRLRAARAVPVPAPPLGVLQQVNHRRFCLALEHAMHEGGWEGATYADTLEVVEALVRGPSPTGWWIAKRAYGFSGRGRRRLRGGLNAQDRGFVERSLARGQGLVVEPWVERAGDFALHGWIGGQDGDLLLGRPLRQQCSPFGVWQASEIETDTLQPEERQALLAAGESTAAALRRAGYFGPFGIDAFRYRAAGGELRFRALVEINARFSMAWGLGMAGVRRQGYRASEHG
jgi:hypothetical protein